MKWYYYLLWVVYLSLIPSEIEKRKEFISFLEFKEIYSKKSKGGVPC